ncbi:MAG: integrase, partial [Azoarcus sp.]|nr:integrase [Azoarcus sp.]
GEDAHLGNPAKSLRDNLWHFDYVVKKFGVTKKALGVTVHGLRHEALIDHYESVAGVPPPVRGGGEVSPEADKAARLSAAKLAGHNRPRASGAYLGQSVIMRSIASSETPNPESGDLPETSGRIPFA